MADRELAITLWVLDCPFRKDGAPVLGVFGARTDTVVILTLDDWKRLVAQHPEIGRQGFRVGACDVAPSHLNASGGRP